jgi:thiol-disulfide isomerase/thioredoxin
MKSKILLFALLLAGGASKAQITFYDNFDSYNVGAPLGPQSPDWTTWSGVQGGADDVNVSSADAHSGTKSLYFSSTSANGGPQDVILPFGGTHTKGAFTFTSWFKMPAGKGGYFNFQGTAVAGGIYTLNTFFTNAGALNISNSKEEVLSTTYPQGAWFKLDLIADLNTNSWELLIDNVSKGKFQCENFTLASIDYYPTSATDAFYVDDVAYTYTPFTSPTVNAAVGLIGIANGLVSQQRESSVTIRNLGTTPLTSFAINMNANGNQTSQNFSGLNIASGAAYKATLTNPVTLVAGLNTFTATVTNAADTYAADNAKTITFTPVQPGKDKVVVAEEATGTWCGWCPRGAVALDNMNKEFDGFFQGIAVHNGDPMVFAAYDTGLGTLIGGYPSAVVDRLGDIDPSAIKADFLKRIVLTPVANLKNGSYLDATTGDLSVSVTTNFVAAASGNYKVACVIIEDSVKGTDPGYNQANYYAGGGSGVMGGYELLPGTVPAAQMRYDHVARAIAPSFAGLANAYPASVVSGSSYVHNFKFNVAPWNKNNLHIVSMLIAPDGKIENAKSSTLAEAASNGLVYPTSVNEPIIKPSFATVYPNPAKGTVNLQLNNSNSNGDAKVLVVDINGKVLMSQTQNVKSGTTIIPIVLNGAASGNYMVLVTMNYQTQTVPFTLN